MTEGRYRIAEVAARTGFSTPTLRYYDGIGLVRPTDRTRAGYRLYDDEAVARLRFIARAKQLGCTLDEITDLTEAWESNECAPIKHRLRGVVAEKLADTETRIAELMTLAAELRSTAAVLEAAPLDGPCDETCGCVSETIACTISNEEIPQRIELLERMRSSLTSVERTQTGLLLHFPAEHSVRGDIERFVVDEKRCCQFWKFEIVNEPDRLTMRWDAPPAADDLIAQIEIFFSTDAPITILNGLAPTG